MVVVESSVYELLVRQMPDAPIKEQAVAMTELNHGYFTDWVREYPVHRICPRQH
jgi:hypothetical protein